MAHLIVLRESTTFTDTQDALLGADEEIERNLAKTKYPLNIFRHGYSTPTASEFKFKMYREKRQNISTLAQHLGCRILNPIPNNATFWDLIKPYNTVYDPSSITDKTGRSHKEVSVGRALIAIQYGFKWLYRITYLTANIMALLHFGFNCIKFPFVKKELLKMHWKTTWLQLKGSFKNKYHFFLKPVRVKTTPCKFPKLTKKWHYEWCFGQIEDIERFPGNEEL